MLSVNSNIDETERKLNRLFGDILKATDQALRSIERRTVEHIVDNRNWSGEAVYKSGPMAGQKYDLQDSGRLLGTISNKEFNTISHTSNGRITVGIGNKAELDALKTMRENVSDPNFSYWRVVVYGRASIQGWQFYKTGTEWGVVSKKARGFSIKDPNSVIQSSEPTMMFENGFSKAKMEFSGILNAHLRKVLSK